MKYRYPEQKGDKEESEGTVINWDWLLVRHMSQLRELMTFPKSLLCIYNHQLRITHCSHKSTLNIENYIKSSKTFKTESISGGPSF